MSIDIDIIEDCFEKCESCSLFREVGINSSIGTCYNIDSSYYDIIFSKDKRVCSKWTDKNKGKFSLSQIIEKHRATIDRIAERNPTIKIDDEWRKEEYDKFFEEKGIK